MEGAILAFDYWCICSTIDNNYANEQFTSNSIGNILFIESFGF